MMLRRQAGFSLIEVLIALLITAVGILGVAGLQVVSLQQNRNALLRDQALQAGNDILDRMRANPLTDYATVGMNDVPVSEVNCMNAPCNPGEMAEFDIAQWKCKINPFVVDDIVYDVCEKFLPPEKVFPERNIERNVIIASRLPGGKASIGKVGNIHEITVEWVNDRAGNSSSIILRTQIEN